MKPVSSLRFFHWTTLAKPACDRAIYKRIKRAKARSIVEIGLGDGSRAERVIQAAQKFGAGKSVKYTGIDLFDGRPTEEPSLKLIEMHKRLSTCGVKPQLVPGELSSAVRRIANSHTRTDILIISAGYDADALETSWFFVPRMLHAGSTVMIQDKTEGNFRCLARLDVERLVAKQTPDRAAA
jgi:hypothetical protein